MKTNETTINQAGENRQQLLRWLTKMLIRGDTGEEGSVQARFPVRRANAPPGRRWRRRNNEQ